ncbi:MAG: UDP-N-acetylglucosamine 2-epimerase (non-hydrolyzing) [Verrucomicrobia bacterium]|nr:UDP-N-acetylglucosamine 2-epimerase (non-hydrolyzing) [Verrucomicrobiota bacterium]
MPLIDLIAGARPNFVKIASIIEAIKEAQARGSDLRYRLVHTGQHYDRSLSGSFFKDLGIPSPGVNLEAGSGTQAEQTGAIMVRYEKLLTASSSDLTLVVGDVNSTIACAIVARKLGIPVAHVEAGIRSGDWTMPEEINRVVTDSISNWFFTTSEWAGENLRRSGVDVSRIFFVGNTMVDTLLRHLPRLRPPSCWTEHNLARGHYFVLTLHRPSNVDERSHLLETVREVATGAQGGLVIFPIHPRTRKVLGESVQGELPENLILVEPLRYLEFNFLVKNAKAVITDSGGITEETTVLGVPCLTLRDSTERPETVSIGTNELVGSDPGRIKPALARVIKGLWKKGSIPALWDGNAGHRIVGVLENLRTLI